LIRRVFVTLLCAACVALVSAIVVRAQDAPGGWSIPATAAAEKNPLTLNDTVLVAGKKLFNDRCARCHGLHGKGDGPDGDESHQEDMDLTVAARGVKNPDGVVFYKIWNGRSSSKMPALSKELTKDQVWSIVAYVQSLRSRTRNLP
jgi:mono/diheme cytochrome c family protein